MIAFTRYFRDSYDAVSSGITAYCDDGNLIMGENENSLCCGVDGDTLRMPGLGLDSPGSTRDGWYGTGGNCLSGSNPDSTKITIV